MKPNAKIKLTVAMFCASILALAASANAGLEKIMPKEPTVELNPPEFDWTGFYIGANLGGAWGNYEFSRFDENVEQLFPAPIVTGVFGRNDFGADTFSFPAQEATASAFIGGGQVGFNKQWGHFVLGVEGDFDRTALSHSESFENSATNFIIDSVFFSFTDLTVTRRAETNWIASARARAGYARGRYLLYVTGGAAFADVSVWTTETANANLTEENILFLDSFTTSNTSKADNIQVGWTVGGGGEWAITDVVSLGLEFRHSDFGSNNYHFSSHGGVISPGSMNVDLTNDQLMLRVNILLGNFFGRH